MSAAGNKAWRLRNAARGRCIVCGVPAEGFYRCTWHRTLHNERERERIKARGGK